MLTISDTTLESTKECASNFYCLNGKNGPRCAEDMPLCAVDYFIGQTELIVKYTGKTDCAYKSNYGQRFSCTCPVRREIFERYNL